jgi:hypothetical protein
MTTEHEANLALTAAGVTCTAVKSNDPIPETMFDVWTKVQPWRVTLRYQGRRMTVPFFTDSAKIKPPTAARVLYCLASDATANSQSFEDWASDFGYDTDSRKVERVYKLCVQNGRKLRNLLQTDFDKIIAITADL